MSNIRIARTLVLSAGLFVLATSSCASSGFGDVRGKKRLVVEIIRPEDPAKPGNTGSRDAPLALAIGAPQQFRVKVRALNTDGTTDASFSRYVRMSSKPGAIEPFPSNEDTEGRNLILRNGESPEVTVSLVNAYGTTFILADDMGYTPVDPLRQPPPACSNGIDDDGDGTIDAPADDGCAFPNDDSEEGGTFAEGASEPIFYALPRIADIRGLKCEPGLGCSSNGATPYPKEAIQVGTGYDDRNLKFVFDTLVTRISSDGFYVADLSDTRAPVGDPADKQGGFVGLFAFNFNPPPRMRVCDRVKSLGGTASEFFGFTQLSYPTWTLEEWDPSLRRCLLGEGYRLKPGTIGDTAALLALSGSYVRIETAPDKSLSIKVTPKFGPADMKKVSTDPMTGEAIYQAFPPSKDYPDGASNCDLDKDGKIDFTPKSEENGCAQSCTADPECTEWSNYVARSTFRITVTDSNGLSKAVQADATASSSFVPTALKGVPIRHFAGTLHYFSGGSQFTIEARCKEDIIDGTLTAIVGPTANGATKIRVENVNGFQVGDIVRIDDPTLVLPKDQPPPFDHRVILSIEGDELTLVNPVGHPWNDKARVTKAPRSPDLACNTDADCPLQSNPQLAQYPIQCVPLRNGEKACRWTDGQPAPDGQPTLHAPDLACVTPRTVFENNPQ